MAAQISKVRLTGLSRDVSPTHRGVGSAGRGPGYGVSGPLLKFMRGLAFRAAKPKSKY